eukprot:Ihof_evm3s4 gene=Ihof_evmTU3s4
MDTQEDQLGISWYSADWFAWNKLEHQNALSYFAESPFFKRDEGCINATIRLQNNLSLMPFPSATCNFNRLPGVAGEPYDPRQMKEQRQVLEYDVLPVDLLSSEPIFVIVKQFREDATDVKPEAYYYILRGSIYQAPDMASLMNARMVSILYNLQEAFEEVQEYRRFHPSKGYSWAPIETPSTTTGGPKKNDPIKNRIHDRSRSAAAEFSRRIPMVIEQANMTIPLPGLKKTQEQDQPDAFIGSRSSTPFPVKEEETKTS